LQAIEHDRNFSRIETNFKKKTFSQLWEEKKSSLSSHVTTASDITRHHRFKHLSDAKEPVLSAITVRKIKQPPRQLRQHQGRTNVKSS